MQLYLKKTPALVFLCKLLKMLQDTYSVNIPTGSALKNGVFGTLSNI